MEIGTELHCGLCMLITLMQDIENGTWCLLCTEILLSCITYCDVILGFSIILCDPG